MKTEDRDVSFAFFQIVVIRIARKQEGVQNHLLHEVKFRRIILNLKYTNPYLYHPVI